MPVHSHTPQSALFTPTRPTQMLSHMCTNWRKATNLYTQKGYPCEHTRAGSSAPCSQPKNLLFTRVFAKVGGSFAKILAHAKQYYVRLPKSQSKPGSCIRRSAKFGARTGMKLQILSHLAGYSELSLTATSEPHQDYT